MKVEDTIVGIVTYNPNVNLLKENIIEAEKQVDNIIIIDNNSDNFDEILQLKKFCNFECIVNPKNFGIAKALNQIFEYADMKRYKYVLTLDQDSIAPCGYAQYAKNILDHNSEIAIVCPQIFDMNIQKEIIRAQEEVDEVKKCISSGCVIKIDAWKKVGGFWEYLFIDYVDFSFCEEIRNNGMKIVRTNKFSVQHTLGDAQIRKLLFFRVRVTNHNSFRKYYIARNIILYLKRYGNFCKNVFEILRIQKVILVTVFYEKNKVNKIYAIIRGIIEGITTPIKITYGNGKELN